MKTGAVMASSARATWGLIEDLARHYHQIRAGG
jgi:hypothetical protein